MSLQGVISKQAAINMLDYTIFHIIKMSPIKDAFGNRSVLKNVLIAVNISHF